MALQQHDFTLTHGGGGKTAIPKLQAAVTGGQRRLF